MTDVIDGAPAFYSRFPNRRFVGAIAYRDADGRRYDESFTIDLGYRKELARVSTPEVAEELSKMREALEAIASRGTEG